ncbi:PREDICTED: uncharacterized protein LOC104716909 isoform X1 [Camelina sativa]|uniref:Uncharacterized protein LOC104716909 isoform X1 n=1 Tax=Camelina sativa TaxID=90675 RepID=A0ABM0TX09_CAMSA|nr:PREDICTED: uncharacterized protein LOC104716909 isoform X1 [Camelina sativa]
MGSCFVRFTRINMFDANLYQNRGQDRFMSAIAIILTQDRGSRVLKLERKSLEFLLKHYCGVAATKEYQNAGRLENTTPFGCNDKLAYTLDRLMSNFLIHSLWKQFNYILKEAGLVNDDSALNNKLD